MNKYEIAATVAINALEGRDFQKLSARRQRDLFGFAAFGRKSVNFDSSNQGTIRVSVSKAFGTDSYTKSLSYQEFAELCNKQEKIEI
jgi:hypothetical protein